VSACRNDSQKFHHPKNAKRQQEEAGRAKSKSHLYWGEIVSSLEGLKPDGVSSRGKSFGRKLKEAKGGPSLRKLSLHSHLERLINKKQIKGEG